MTRDLEVVKDSRGIFISHRPGVFDQYTVNETSVDMPTEEENNRWKKYLKVRGLLWNIIQQKNGNAEKIQEMKENALKKRKEKFKPENDTTMVDKITERTKKEAETAEEVVPPAMSTPVTERLVEYFA